MALLVTAQCDRCPTRAEFNPLTDKCHKYRLEGSHADPVGRTVILPVDWGLLELNVGHDKDVQEICPACVALNRSFMKEPSKFLPAAPEPEVKLLPESTRSEDGDP